MSLAGLLVQRTLIGKLFTLASNWLALGWGAGSLSRVSKAPNVKSIRNAWSVQGSYPNARLPCRQQPGRGGAPSTGLATGGLWANVGWARSYCGAGIVLATWGHSSG